MRERFGICVCYRQPHTKRPTCLDWLPCETPVHLAEPRLLKANAPIEMTSLREIKDKLDELLAILKGNEVWPGLDKRSDNLFALQATNFAALAESQGKLLAALDDVHSSLKIKAESTVQQIREEIAKRQEFTFAVFQRIEERLETLEAGLHETAMRNHVQLLDGQKAISERIDKRIVSIGALIEERCPPRKARKKARRR